MKFKSTWVLLLVAIALGLYVYFIEFKKAARDEEKKAAQEKILDFDVTKVKGLALKSSHGEFKFEKDGEAWKMTSPVADLADTSAVNGMVSDFNTEKFEDTIEGENPSKFGLDKPALGFTLTFQDGSTKNVNVGSDAALAGKIYVQRNGDKDILLASASLKYQIDKEIKDLRDKHIFRKSKQEIQFITAKFNSKTLKSQVGLTKKGDDWILESRNEVADHQTVTTFLSALENLNATNFPSQKADEKSELKKFNLLKPALDLNLEDKDHKVVAHLLISDKKDNIAYAKVDGGPTIYQIFASAAEGLMKSPDDFRNKTIPFTFKKDEVTDLFIKTSLPEVHLVKKGAQWELPLQDPQKQVDQIQVTNFINKVAGLKVAEYTKETPKGLNPPLGHVILKNAKGDVLLDFSWGERTKTPRNYFAKSNLYKGIFSVEGGTIDSLPNQTLVEKKPDPNAPKPSPTPLVGKTPFGMRHSGIKPQLPGGGNFFPMLIRVRDKNNKAH